MHAEYQAKVRRSSSSSGRRWSGYRQSGVRGVIKIPRTGTLHPRKYDALTTRRERTDARYGAFMLLRSRKDQLIVDNTPAYALLDAATFAEMAGISADAQVRLRDARSRRAGCGPD